MAVLTDGGGGRRLATTLAEAAAELDDPREAHAHAADAWADRARVLAPRLTGRLAASVRSDTHNTGPAVIAAVPYAAAVHARFPFVAQAATDTAAELLEIYAAHAANALGQVKGT